jgi:hypothetical protein
VSRKRNHSFLIALSTNTNGAFFEIEIRQEYLDDLARPEATEEHEPHDTHISPGAKALGESLCLFRAQGLDQASRFLLVEFPGAGSFRVEVPRGGCGGRVVGM